MECNDAGKKLIKSSEGCRLEVYPDARGFPTAGYGHRVNLPLGTPITMQQAEQWFDDDIASVAKQLDDAIKYELNDNEFSALVSFVYNIGIGNFLKSGVKTALDNGDLDDVPDHMMLWCNAGGKPCLGLERRRDAEGNLWRKPVRGNEGDL